MAEYEACILGLRIALDMDINELLLIEDSVFLIHQVQGKWDTKNENILPYVNLAQRLHKKFKKIEFRHTLRAQNEFADALATIASMIQHPESNHIDPLRISLKEEHARCYYVEAEPDGKLWYSNIKMYLEGQEYPKGITNGQKKTIRRMANGFFPNKEVLYKRTPDLGLLRRVDASEATKLLEEVHVGTCGPYMNGFVLPNKILRAGYYWMTMESDCCKYVQRCHQCQIHGDLIKEAELDDAEWVRARYKQLALIDEKRMVAVCHGQSYRQRMARAFNKRVRTRLFQIGKLVLKRSFPQQEEYKGKFSPN
ncbi:uncharacterized protein LOC132637515 [Lycium barbarum]|uniref:uncharacterized protein LOC132637515 n=1 Tax=Lycium barbarum TaxID=112863 RepID=UPI00293E9CA9|nr:uncharacterized protein LOC132637515 [Lycium barbarum]